MPLWHEYSSAEASPTLGATLMSSWRSTSYCIHFFQLLLRYAILSNLFTRLDCIRSQSNETNTPDEPPTCLTPDSDWAIYVGKFKLKDSAIDKICK